MPHIEVIPNSTSISAPGWAYVPDDGYDPSKLPIQPTGARKRAARASGLTAGDTSTRQQNAVLKHLAELDKDGHRDVQIPIPAKHKDGANKGSRNKVTQNVRRILASQKTFANHLADEEAAFTSQDQNTVASATPRTGIPRPAKTTTAPPQKYPSAAVISSPTIGASETPRVRRATSMAGAAASYPVVPTSSEDDPLLKIYVPSPPSDAVMEALVSGPALSYNGARAAPSVGKPQRHFCENCGYWGTIRCLKCGARVCGLECRKAHAENRCIFYA